MRRDCRFAVWGRPHLDRAPRGRPIGILSLKLMVGHDFGEFDHTLMLSSLSPAIVNGVIYVCEFRCPILLETQFGRRPCRNLADLRGGSRISLRAVRKVGESFALLL